MELLAGTSKGLFIVGDVQGPAARCVLHEGGVRAIAGIGDALFAGTDAGVRRSEDGGQTWGPAGVESRMVWQIAPAPGEPATLYAVTEPAGVFKSPDGGREWTEIESFIRMPEAARWCLPLSPPTAARARTIVIDAADPRSVWIGVEVGGIVSSRDGGASWQVDQPGGNPDIHVMVAHPAKRSVLFVTTGYGRLDGVAEMVEGNAGVYRSDGAGFTWQFVWRGREPRYTRPLCIDPRPPYGLTVACAPTAFSSHRDPGGAGAMLYRTEDEGRTWRSLCDGTHAPSAANFHAVEPAPDAPGAVLVGTDTGEVWRVSGDAHWTLLASGLPPVLSLSRRP